MARLPIATRDTVPQGQQDAFDEIVQRVGETPRYGPPSVTIHVPQAHKLTFALNDYLRSDGCLPLKVQELAMLVAAREMDCQHIWNSHVASARSAGVPVGWWMLSATKESCPPWLPMRRLWCTWAGSSSAPTR